MVKTARRRERTLALAGALFTLAAGAALGPLWDWTGRGRAAAAFCVVNGSVWEGMKRVLLPAFIFSMAQAWAQDGRGLLAARGVSLWAGAALVPALHYTLLGAVGRADRWTDGVILLLAAAAVFFLDLPLRRTGRLTAGWQQAAGLASLWLAVLLAALWTYRPPISRCFRTRKRDFSAFPPLKTKQDRPTGGPVALRYRSSFGPGRSSSPRRVMVSDPAESSVSRAEKPASPPAGNAARSVTSAPYSASSSIPPAAESSSFTRSSRG